MSFIASSSTEKHSSSPVGTMKMKLLSLSIYMAVGMLLAVLIAVFAPFSSSAADGTVVVPQRVVEVEGSANTAQPQQALPPGVSQAWWSAAQQAIIQSEYDVRWTNQTALRDVAAAYQAPNRANDMRSYFTPTGLRIVPRAATTDYAPAWELGITLEGYGAADALTPLGPNANMIPQLSTDGNRVTYQWGPVTEWYVNDSAGLKQNFEIAERPANLAHDANLVLALGVSDRVIPSLQENGQAIHFQMDNGTVVRYDSLVAYDATGRSLPARMELVDGRIHLVVDDTNAVYPVTIDPLFGLLFTLDADTIIQPNKAGALLGFSLTTTDPIAGGHFVVGAPNYDSGVAGGAVFIFNNTGTGIVSNDLSDPTTFHAIYGHKAGMNFGWSVASCDVNGSGQPDIIVGAPKYASNAIQVDEGGVFTFSDAVLTPNATTNAADTNGGNQIGLLQGNQIGAQLGFSVACGDFNGDSWGDVAAGAPYWENDSVNQLNEGIVLIAHGSNVAAPPTLTNGDSTTQIPGPNVPGRYTIAETNQAQGRSGWSLAVGEFNGDSIQDLAIGAPYYNGGVGAVFVYHGSGVGLGGSPAVTLTDGQTGSEFGYSVATGLPLVLWNPSSLAVGAPKYNGGVADEGAAFVFNYDGATTLGTTPGATARSGQAGSRFGHSVALIDTTGVGTSDLVVGAPLFERTTGLGYTVNGPTNEGAALLFLAPAANNLTVQANAHATIAGNQANAELGTVVANLGNVDGDTGNIQDLGVGAPKYDYGETDEGHALIYYSSSTIAVSGVVWNDANGNGVQDPGEIGVQNVTVDLYRTSDNTLIGNGTTGVNGRYEIAITGGFLPLPPGGLSVYAKFSNLPVVPPNWTFSPAKVSGVDESLNSDATTITGIGVARTNPFLVSSKTNNSNQSDAGIYPYVELGGYVWNDGTDTTPYDGQRVNPPVLPADLSALQNGVVVELYESVSGSMGGLLQTTTTGFNDASLGITNNNGQYHFRVPVPATATDYFIRVNANTNTFDFTLQSANPLAADNDSNVNSNGVVKVTLPVAVPANSKEVVGAGIYQFATINGRIWSDTNANGIQDGGELSLAGVLLEVRDSVGNQLPVTALPLVKSTFTDSSGNYSLRVPPLATGYRVRLDQAGSAAAFANFQISPKGMGTNTALDSDFYLNATGAGTISTDVFQSDIVTLSAGQTAKVDGGMFPFATIQGTVFNDNGAGGGIAVDGVKQAGEGAVAGNVLVYIDQNADGTYNDGIELSATQAGGLYNLRVGVGSGYRVMVDPSTITTPSPAGPTTPLPRLVNTTSAGQTVANVHLGFVLSNSSIAGNLWNDINGNGASAADAGEPPIPNVQIDLYRDTNLNGILDIGVDLLVNSTNTDNLGNYSFNQLAASKYFVSVAQSNFLGSGPLVDFYQTFVGYPPNPAEDHVQVIQLGDNANITNANASYQQRNAVVQGRVWNDSNGNATIEGVPPDGQDQTPASLGMAGVRVFLDRNNNGKFDQGEPDTFTNSAGNYVLTGIGVGANQKVRVDVDQVKSISAFSQFGLTTTPVYNVTITTPGQVVTDRNFGWQLRSSSLSGFVWLDNGAGGGIIDNGIKDGGEGPVPGASSVDCGNFPRVYIDLIDTTTSVGNGQYDGGEPFACTNAAGNYIFSPAAGNPLGAGIQRVSVDPLTTAPNSGYNITFPNKPGPAIVALTKWQVLTGFNIGMQRADGVIEGIVWNDNGNGGGIPGDGVKDTGEPVLANIMVYLDQNQSGAYEPGEMSATTGTSGDYKFQGLATGTYYIAVDESQVSAIIPDFGPTTPAGAPAMPYIATINGVPTVTADLGFQRQDGVIKGFVFVDGNNNGTFDGGEQGIPNVALRLYYDLLGNGVVDTNDPIIRTATSAVGGFYAFPKVGEGKYVVWINPDHLPEGAVASFNPPHTSPVRVLHNTPFYCPATCFATPGEPAVQVNFSYLVGIIKGVVWDDANGDAGVQAGEGKIGGVKLYLYQDDGNLQWDGALTDVEIATATAAAGTGEYAFKGLQNANYFVGIDPTNNGPGDGPGGVVDKYFVATYGAGARYNRAPGNPIDIITDDIPPTNRPPGGVSTLYSVLGVGVAQDLNFGYWNSNGVINVTNIWNDENGDGIDQTATSAGPPEPYIEGVVVQLWLDHPTLGNVGTLDTSGATDILIAQHTTGTNNPNNPDHCVFNDCKFSDLGPGSYFVHVVEDNFDAAAIGNAQPPDGKLTGFVRTGGNPGGSDRSSMIVLQAGNMSRTATFGYQLRNGSLSGRVWIDSNGNGIFEPSESAFGQAVRVYIDLNGNGRFDPSEPNAQTDPSGNYVISALPASNAWYLNAAANQGKYVVRVDRTTLPPGYYPRTGYNGVDPALTDFNIPGANPAHTIGIEANSLYDQIKNNGEPPSSVAGVNFGFVESSYIGGRVWNDRDGDGVRGPILDEPGLPSIHVRLYRDTNGNGVFDTGDALFDELFTDANGDYNFSVPPEGGSYFFNVNVLINSLFTEKYATGATTPDGRSDDSDIDPNSAGTDLIKVNAVTGTPPNIVRDVRFQASVSAGLLNPGTITGLIFNDLDGDGIFNGGAGETGRDGVTVELLDSSGEVLISVTTPTTGDPSGVYTFAGIPAGDYYIQVINPNTETLAFSPQNRGTNPLIDSDVFPATGRTPVVSVGENQTRSGINAGLYHVSTITGIVFDDLNGNGIRDEGEPGIEGAVVWIDRNRDGVQDDDETVTTDADGQYLFDAVPLGTLNIQVDETSLPGYTRTTPAQVPVSIIVDAASTDYTGPTFGYQATNGIISGVVFEDYNGNGIQDANEHGWESIVVFLDLNGNGLVDIGEPFVLTDVDGKYKIENLAAGDYALMTSGIPDGYVLTVPDALPMTVTVVADTEVVQEIGYQLPPPANSIISGIVFDDENVDGVRGLAEPGLPNVEIALAVDGTAILTTTTDVAGFYEFTNVVSGTYTISVSEDTVRDEDTIPSVDRDDYELTTNNNPSEVIVDGQNTQTIEFGYGIPFVDGIDMRLTKTTIGGSASFAPGSTIGYQIGYDNRGLQAARSVVITDTIPVGTRFVKEASDSRWECIDDTCELNVGIVESGASASVVLVVQVDENALSGTVITNRAIIGHPDPDARPHNNAAEVSNTIEMPSLEISKSADVPFAEPGDTIIYTIAYTNTSTTRRIGDVSFTETIPVHTTFLPDRSNPAWACNRATAGSTCVLSLTEPLTITESGAITFTVRLDTAIADNISAIVNAASGTGYVGDYPYGDLLPDTGATTFTPIRRIGDPDFAVTKEATRDGDAVNIAETGDRLTYRIVVTNIGRGGGENVSVTDVLPEGLTYVEGSATLTATYDLATRTITWDLGTVYPTPFFQPEIVLEYAVTVDDTAVGKQLKNQATVATTTPETITDNNTAIVVVQIEGAALELAKILDTQAVEPGGTIQYTLIYTNTGNRDATDVVIEDELPEGTTLVASESTEGWTQVGESNTYRLTIGTVPGGITDSVKLIVRVNDDVPVGTKIVNTATISGRNVAAVASASGEIEVGKRAVYFPSILQDRADAPVEPEPEPEPGTPDLTISNITITPSNPTAGQPAVVSVTLQNLGDGDASGFWVDLYLNPDRTPEVGLRWDSEVMCDPLNDTRPCFYGLSWAVIDIVAKDGGEIVLTSAVSNTQAGVDPTTNKITSGPQTGQYAYSHPHSRWFGWLPNGTSQVCAFADVWSPDEAAGGTLPELNETNNLLCTSINPPVTGTNPPLPSNLVGIQVRN